MKIAAFPHRDTVSLSERPLVAPPRAPQFFSLQRRFRGGRSA